MIRIHSIKKSKKQYVVEFLKDDHVFLHTLYEEVVIAFALFRAKDVEESVLQAILKENAYYEAHHFALDKLKKRLTESEVRALLHKKEVSEANITRICTFLHKHRLLDDAMYAKDYVLMALSSKGPLAIRKRLLEKGISLTLVNNALTLYNETKEREVIEQQLNKLKLQPIKLTKPKLKEKWVRALLQKGHTQSLVFALVEEALTTIKRWDVTEVLQKDLIKALKRCSDKSDRRCKEKVIRSLMQKGHSYESIQAEIRKEGCFDETEEHFE